MATPDSLIDAIGDNAGDVYRYLEEQQDDGRVRATEIKDELKMTTADIYQAIGWLAREDNLEVFKQGNSVQVDLNGQ